MHPSAVGLLLVGCVSGAPTSTTPSTAGTGPQPPALQEDRILVAASGVVDVLVVVDPTEPAAPAVAQFVEQFPVLLEAFVGSGLDWHVAVVSADLDGPDAGLLSEIEGARWVDADRPNPSELLGALATLPGPPGTRSQPTGAVWEALEVRAADNEGFLRPDSALRVVVVGTGADDTLPEHLPGEGFDAWFSVLRPETALRSMSCVVTAPATSACATTAATTGGVSVDLDGVGEVALHAAALTQRFPLTQLPRSGTLEVEVEADGAVLGFTEAVDWTYDPVANAVDFVDYVPGPLSTVVLRYRPT
jgi:hypothetical protein